MWNYGVCAESQPFSTEVEAGLRLPESGLATPRDKSARSIAVQRHNREITITSKSQRDIFINAYRIALCFEVAVHNRCSGNGTLRLFLFNIATSV
jgi:hypothetical protein